MFKGRDNSIAKKIWEDANFPLKGDTFYELIMNASRDHNYHSKNRHLLIHDPNIHKIWMMEDCNIGGMFWRYFWMQNDTVYLYTGDGVLGEAETELLNQSCFDLEKTRIQVTHKEKGQYVLDKIIQDKSDTRTL